MGGGKANSTVVVDSNASGTVGRQQQQQHSQQILQQDSQQLLRALAEFRRVALRSDDRAIVLVTHYQRLLSYITPDFVHILSDGRIVKSGGRELALGVEEEGYTQLRRKAAPA